MATDTRYTLVIAIVREDNKHVNCTVPLSNWLRQDICCCVDGDIELNSTNFVGNEDNIRELFSFKGEWFIPCDHEG